MRFNFFFTGTKQFLIFFLYGFLIWVIFWPAPILLACLKPLKKASSVNYFLYCLYVYSDFGYFNLKFLSQSMLFFWGMGGSEYATNWLSPNVILMSLSGYFLIMPINGISSWIDQVIHSVAKASLGIYLIHLIIINLLDKYLGFYLDFQTGKLWLYGIKKMIVVFLLSWIITLIAGKIPLLKIIFGEKSSRG